MLVPRDLAARATRSVILALPNSAVTAATADQLRRKGWRVYCAETCDALRRLTCRLTPEVVVLPADGSDESGWLTCAKLLRENAGLRMIVVGEATAEGNEYARFIGIEALVPGDATADELADQVEGVALQSM
jgi:DNA-binding response OmpR family regulator